MYLAVPPDFNDNKKEDKYRQAMKNWDKKLDRLDDEMLIYVRERINYLLEVRSQKYLAEMERNERLGIN
jgi:hypothetical protein